MKNSLLSTCANADKLPSGRANAPTVHSGALKVLACALAALMALAFCVSSAQALELGKLTGKGTDTNGTSILAGVATRFTFEATVGEDEELSTLTLAFPDGTAVTGDSLVKCTVLQGTKRIDTPYEYQLDGEGARITFTEPVGSGELLRVEVHKLIPPTHGGEYPFDLAVSYTTPEVADAIDAGSVTCNRPIVGKGVVEGIVDWLDQQSWVEAWNSNTFLRLFFNPQIAVQSFPNLFNGWLIALSLVLIGFPLAIPIGLAFAFMRMGNIKILRAIASLYVNVVRGTPLFLQIYIWFFGLPLLGINLNSFVLGFIALALNSGAYLCEIFRAGIQSIPKGQFEASRSLGMNHVQTMFSVIIPQSVRRIIPTATSEFILLYKDTSLLASVGVMELMMFSKSITANTGNITPYIVAACYYLIVTIPLTKLIGTFEKRLAAADGVRPSEDDLLSGAVAQASGTIVITEGAPAPAADDGADDVIPTDWAPLDPAGTEGAQAPGTASDGDPAPAQAPGSVIDNAKDGE